MTRQVGRRTHALAPDKFLKKRMCRGPRFRPPRRDTFAALSASAWEALHVFFPRQTLTKTATVRDHAKNWSNGQYNLALCNANSGEFSNHEPRNTRGGRFRGPRVVDQRFSTRNSGKIGIDATCSKQKRGTDSTRNQFRGLPAEALAQAGSPDLREQNFRRAQLASL